MDFFFYDAPIWIAMPSFILIFLALSWAVLLLLRPWVKRAALANEEWDRVLNYAMSSYGIFYGILLALIAVSVYENFQRVDGVVLDEVSSLGALYRAVSSYPSPIGAELQEELRLYTQGVIAVDWPSMQANIIPTDGSVRIDNLQNTLFAYEPVTSGETVVHSQTIGLFFDFLEDRRARLEETRLALPGLLWAVLTVGAVLNAVMIGLVEAKNLRVHLIMSGIIAIFVALLIFVTLSMDHPYSGAISITPEMYQNLLDQLMAK